MLYEVLVHITFKRCDGIWISDIHRDWIPQLCARHWASFLSHCCSSIIYNVHQPFLVILCDTLFRRSKLIFFAFESAETCRFLYIKDKVRKILLKLINFMSRNSGVKYFPLLATLAAKLIHFCTHTAAFHCIYPILNCDSLDERR